MLNTSLMHFSAVTIDIGNVWDILAKTVHLRKESLIGIKECTSRLSDLVQQGEISTLWVSTGPADFVAQWLPRLYSEANEKHVPGPKIDKLVIKHLDLNLANKMQKAGILEPLFYEKLKVNLKTLTCNHALSAHHVKVKCRTWEKLPPFHGFLFREECLIGQWGVGIGGYLHVQTHLNHIRKSDLPNVYSFVLKQFKK